jgi:hypothetical protein
MSVVNLGQGGSTSVKAQITSGFAVLILCASGPFLAGDVLNPQNVFSREIGALVDGHKNGVQINDERHIYDEKGGFFSNLFPTIPIGGFTSEDGNDEVIAFSKRQPPLLVQHVPWTPANNKIDLDFDDEYAIPAQVWIVAGPFPMVRATAAAAAVATAGIWNDERQGVTFGSFDIVDATGDEDAEDFLDFTCGLAASIKAQIGHVPGRLNVYYVKTVNFGAGPSSGAGVWCSGQKIIAMGWFTSPELLAHEFGHAFHLLHTNTNPQFSQFFDNTNVMHNASNHREFLSEGQTFISVYHGSSAINNIYDVRAGGVTRSCSHHIDEANIVCPPLQTRIWADGTWPPN